MKKTFADPVKMMELGAPRVLRSDEELERYTETLYKLTGKARPSVAEIEAINLLSLLVEIYEARRFAIEASSPVEVLRFLMEQNGLKQIDLVSDLGSASHVSLILAGKRNLTLANMQRLSRRFGVPVTVFLDSCAAAA